MPFQQLLQQNLYGVFLRVLQITVLQCLIEGYAQLHSHLLAFRMFFKMIIFYFESY